MWVRKYAHRCSKAWYICSQLCNSVIGLSGTRATHVIELHRLSGARSDHEPDQIRHAHLWPRV